MIFWLLFLLAMIIWGIVTILYLLNSTANINLLSVIANIVTPIAGLQASLAMRKADDRDNF